MESTVRHPVQEALQAQASVLVGRIACNFRGAGGVHRSGPAVGKLKVGESFVRRFVAALLDILLNLGGVFLVAISHLPSGIVQRGLPSGVSAGDRVSKGLKLGD